jgi:hypothetical protein
LAPHYAADAKLSVEDNTQKTFEQEVTTLINKYGMEYDKEA